MDSRRNFRAIAVEAWPLHFGFCERTMKSGVRTAIRSVLLAFFSGCAFKAIWILLWRWTHADWLLAGIEFWDPGPYRFAELCIGFVFDQRRTLPGPSEACWFDTLLVFGSGLQWMIAGLVVRACIQRIRRT